MPAPDDDPMLVALARGAASVDDTEVRATLRADPRIRPEVMARLERFFSLIDEARAEAK